jgi:hypothetical protein
MKLSILKKKRNLAGLTMLILIAGVILISKPQETTANEMNIQNNPVAQMNEQIHLIVSRTDGLSSIKMNSVAR